MNATKEIFYRIAKDIYYEEQKKSMKAALHRQYGSPEVIFIGNVPKPIPKNDEILIRVHATTVNRTDCGFRSAEYVISRLFSGIWKPKNPVLGNEFAGIVEEIGSKVQSFAVGDRVFGYNDSAFGAHAEYMTVSEHSPVALMPVNTSFEQAAPILEGGHYALCDIKAAKVQQGQKVLVNGATGAIGSAAVQLLHYYGAEVTAVCAKPYHQIIRSLGATTVIDYLSEDFTQINEKFDFVFDAVGKSSFGKCKKLLKEKGIYISTEFGEKMQNPLLALWGIFSSGKRVLFPLPTISKNDVLFFRDLTEQGKFKPLIDRKYSLDDIKDAHFYVETGQKIGNVVITVS